MKPHNINSTLLIINWLSPKANPQVKFSRVITLVQWVRLGAN